MPTHYLHTHLAYEKIFKESLRKEEELAFLLGAIAPDAVPFGQTKRRSHYNFHYGITWFYRFNAFETEFADYQQQSPLHHWFYLGYRYHLRLDWVWVKCCLNPAMIRLGWNQLIKKGPQIKAKYYEEMGRYDDYFRATQKSPPVELFDQLKHTDHTLLPSFLDTDRLGTIFEHLQQTVSQTCQTYEGGLLPHKNIDRFHTQAAKLEAI